MKNTFNPRVGTQVGIKKHWWRNNGNGLTKVDAHGFITSRKGRPGHTNVHKFEITTDSGKYYTDNLNNELYKVTPELKNLIDQGFWQ